MKQRKHCVLGIIGALLLSLWFVGIGNRGVFAAPMQQAEAPIFIYFFWGDGCPHCAEAKLFLQDLARRYPNVQVEAFEVWYDADNQVLFQQMAAAYNFEPHYVPTIFVGVRQWEGFSAALRQELETVVRTCVEIGCADAGTGIVPGHELQPKPTEVQVPATFPVSETGRSLTIYLFWGEGCSQCETTPHLEGTANKYPPLGAEGAQEVVPFLKSLTQQHPQVQLHLYEVWYAPHNQKRFDTMAAAFGFESRGVPTVFIGDQYWEGYSVEIGTEITAYVQMCLETGCPDMGVRVLEQQVTPSPMAALTSLPQAPATSYPTSRQPSPPSSADTTIHVPLLGMVNLGVQSLWISTALISFVDGFNPCSLWVLSILIALTLRAGSRKKLFIIGLTFITVTALVYVLFIAGLFTMFTFIRFLGWIRAAVSLLALFFAVINIKDYFWYQAGLSFTIDDAQKPGLYKRVRQVMRAGDALGALLLATVSLGVGVSLVGFSCTAGFPVLWTNLVAAQNVSPLTFALLLLLYMVIYQIDELGIFLAAVVTLRVSRLEEKHGRILKLIGGMLMLTLAVVMLIKPALMNDLLSSVLIFGAAFGAALLVLVIHRMVLPCFGVTVGTEMDVQARGRKNP